VEHVFFSSIGLPSSFFPSQELYVAFPEKKNGGLLRCFDAMASPSPRLAQQALVTLRRVVEQGKPLVALFSLSFAGFMRCGPSTHGAPSVARTGFQDSGVAALSPRNVSPHAWFFAAALVTLRVLSLCTSLRCLLRLFALRFLQSSPGACSPSPRAVWNTDMTNTDMLKLEVRNKDAVDEARSGSDGCTRFSGPHTANP